MAPADHRLEHLVTGTLPATKLRPPQPRPRVVERAELVDQLARGARGRLTVVSAPAGWGKTTLVLDWCRRAGRSRPFAWVALDPDDGDPSRFWACVVQALDAALPTGLPTAARIVDAGRRVEAGLITAIVNDLTAADCPAIVVLDDYHAVRSARVDRALDELIERLPAGVHVTLVGRDRPSLDLARLRAQGELTELDARDLRFTRAETASLLRDVLGLRLAADDVRALHERTEGWAAALQLAALSLRGRRGGDTAAAIRGFTGHDEHLVDYLGAEVLGGLDQDLQSFLVQTSILARMTGDLCDAVTGRTDSARLLARVERESLFVVRLDAYRRWYRYHRLFADVLRLRLAAWPPGEVAELHRRAAEWYADEGSVTDAVRHALLARDDDLAHRVVSEHWNATYNLGRLTTVSGWLDALGDDRVRGDPWLSAARVLVWADEGRLDELDAWLATDESRTVDGYPYAIMRALHRFKSGDLARAADDLDRAGAMRVDTHPFWPTVEHCVRGVTAYWSDDPAGAGAALASAVTLARSYGNLAGRTYATGYLALVAIDAGDLPLAARRLDELAAEQGPDSDLAGHFVMALPELASARLAEAAGDPERALLGFEHAVTLARGGAGRLERVATLAALGRAHERAGDRPRALAMLTEATALVRACPDPGRAVALVADQPGARRRGPSGERAHTRITPREAAVLRLLPSQMSLREIADHLYVSHNTAKTHARTLYRKLAATSREQAVRNAHARGLL